MQPENPPTYEETTQGSKAMMADFISRIKRASNWRSLQYILLADVGLSLDDKCKAMENAVNIPAITEEKDTVSLEDALWLQGSHKLAQSVCYYYHIACTSADRSWCKALIEADIEIRWIVQRMIWIHHQLQVVAYRKAAFEEALKALSPKYWRAHGKLWVAIDHIQSRSAARGLARQRAHIYWYLSAELREDCVRRGGCCGRTCGCCERPRTIDGLKTEGMHNRGHCTSACSCCLKAHGLDGNYIGEEITDLQDLRFDTTATQWVDTHTLRLLKGYVFYFK